MITVKCTRCLATANGTDMEDARSKIDHAPGLARGIPCGDNFNQVFETITGNDTSDKPTIKTDSSSYKKVEGKSAEKIKIDESKTSKSKSVKE